MSIDMYLSFHVILFLGPAGEKKNKPGWCSTHTLLQICSEKKCRENETS